MGQIIPSLLLDLTGHNLYREPMKEAFNLRSVFWKRAARNGFVSHNLTAKQPHRQVTSPATTLPLAKLVVVAFLRRNLFAEMLEGRGRRKKCLDPEPMLTFQA
jgi:hypothetical protein